MLVSFLKRHATHADKIIADEVELQNAELEEQELKRVLAGRGGKSHTVDSTT